MAGMTSSFMNLSSKASQNKNFWTAVQQMGGTDELKATAGKALEKAELQQTVGQVGSVIGMAGDLFNNIYGIVNQTKEAKNQYQATIDNAQTNMMQLENRLLATKTNIQDRFNKLVVHNTVETAAKNLKVSASSVLEQSKNAAYEANLDIGTAESNTRLQEIALQSQIDMANIGMKLANKLRTAGIVGAFGNTIQQAGMMGIK